MRLTRISIITLTFFLIHVAENSYAQDLMINEVQYSNQNTLHDSEGDSNDWIELLNVGSLPILLSGYQLTDDPGLADTWALPDLLLQPGGFFLIHASGKDVRSGPEIHADFKLGLMRDPIGLLGPDGVVINWIEPRCVPPDKSLGRWPDASGDFQILSPSPGNSNNGATPIEINFQMDSISFSHPSGAYKGPVEIELSQTHSHNQILYTLDGEDPDRDELLYEGPIILQDINGGENHIANLGDADFRPGNLISKASIIRAIVLSEGCPASEEVCHTYFINPSGRLEYMVPVISLVTEEENLFDEETGIYVKGEHDNFTQRGKKWERAVHMEMIDNSGTPVFSQHAGMRIHGRGTRYGNQKSFRLYAREEYGENTFNYPFFDDKPELHSYRTLLLRASKGWSRTLFKDDLCHSIVQEMGLDHCATQTVVVFLNGEYWGIYSLRERHDKYYVENNYKLDPEQIDIIELDPMNLEVKAGTIDRYEELIENLEQHDPMDVNYLSTLEEWFDLEKLMDFYIAHFYLANADFPQNNFEMWRLQGDSGQWHFFFYDLDGTMSRTYSDQFLSYHNSYNDQYQYQEHSTVVFGSLLKNREFRALFMERYKHHLETTFAPSRILTLIKEYEALYEPLAAEHIYRWNEPADMLSWYHNVDMLKSFAAQRPAVLAGQLAQHSESTIYIFPNPMQEELMIDLFDYTGTTEIRIFNGRGQLVFQKQLFAESQITIYPSLEPGLYYLELGMENHTFTEKVVVN
jgi:hypothetical protein